MDSKAIKYPIYIVSKGRWENPVTAKVFLRENIPFKIAVEPQEYDNYKTTIPEKHLLKLPFSNLHLGSFPARNYCWEDSIKNGFDKHFMFDDNIYHFIKPEKGIRKVGSTTASEALRAIIKFTEYFSNIGISGFNYDCFITRETKAPFTYNTHVYSGMLINNKIPFRWRLKYNEDIDLCLQVLNGGMNTLLLNTYTIKKVSTTMKLKGGNQDELYQGNKPEKKILKAKLLQAVWPQYVKTVMRFGRPHHQISWKKHFKHPLRRAYESAS